MISSQDKKKPKVNPKKVKVIDLKPRLPKPGRRVPRAIDGNKKGKGKAPSAKGPKSQKLKK